MHACPDVESQPDQPPNVDPLGVAVNVTVPLVKCALHVVAQLRPEGELVTVPEPAPAKFTVRVGPEPKQTTGMLQRRHIRIEEIKYIGKESNSLEEVESGLTHSAQSVYTEYPDRRRDEWQTKIIPALKKAPLSILAKESGMSRSALKELRAGRSRPHRKNQETLVAILRKMTLRPIL